MSFIRGLLPEAVYERLVASCEAADLRFQLRICDGLGRPIDWTRDGATRRMDHVTVAVSDNRTGQRKGVHRFPPDLSSTEHKQFSPVAEAAESLKTRFATR